MRWLTRVSRILLAGSLAVACLVGLAACSTTGSSFDSSALPLIVPGQTTMVEASALLQSDPVNVYRQLDGSAMAIWAHKATLATDAVYFNQELWLAFGADGRYTHIVKSINIPGAYKADARRPSQPHATAPAPSVPPPTATTYPLTQ